MFKKLLFNMVIVLGSCCLVSCNNGGQGDIGTSTHTAAKKNGMRLKSMGLNIQDASLLGDPATVDSKTPVFNSHYTCVNKSNFSYTLANPIDNQSYKTSYFINVDNNSKFNSIDFSASISGGAGLFKANLDTSLYSDSKVDSQTIQIIDSTEIEKVLSMRPKDGVNGINILSSEYKEKLVNNQAQFLTDCSQGYVSDVSLGYKIDSIIDIRFSDSAQKNKFALALGASYSNVLDLKAKLETFMKQEHTSVAISAKINIYGSTAIPEIESVDRCINGDIAGCSNSLNASINRVKSDIDNRLNNIITKVNKNQNNYDQVLSAVSGLYGLGKVNFSKFRFNELSTIIDIPESQLQVQKQITQAYQYLYGLPQVFFFVKMQSPQKSQEISNDTIKYNELKTYLNERQDDIIRACFGFNYTQCQATINGSRFMQQVNQVESLVKKYQSYIDIVGYYAVNQNKEREIYFYTTDNKADTKLFYPLVLNKTYNNIADQYRVYKNVFESIEFMNPNLIGSVKLESNNKIRILDKSGVEVDSGACSYSNSGYSCNGLRKFNPELFNNLEYTSDKFFDATSYAKTLELSDTLDHYPEKSINTTLNQSNKWCNSDGQCLKVSDQALTFIEKSGSVKNKLNWIEDNVVTSITDASIKIERKSDVKLPLIQYDVSLITGNGEHVLAILPSHEELLFRLNKQGYLVGVPFRLASQYFFENKASYDARINDYINRDTDKKIVVNFFSLKTINRQQEPVISEKGVMYFKNDANTDLLQHAAKSNSYFLRLKTDFKIYLQLFDRVSTLENMPRVKEIIFGDKLMNNNSGFTFLNSYVSSPNLSSEIETFSCNLSDSSMTPITIIYFSNNKLNAYSFYVQRKCTTEKKTILGATFEWKYTQVSPATSLDDKSTDKSGFSYLSFGTTATAPEVIFSESNENSDNLLISIFLGANNE